MGNSNKEKVRLVISHLEGCSGNFLGRLFADQRSERTNLFRVDINLNTTVLSINGRNNWESVVDNLLETHSVVVTHNFNQLLIRSTFPNAKIIKIYPYTHVGNVLHNICFKKLTNKIPNLLDNYLIDIDIWYKHILQNRPITQCTDFWELSNLQSVEQLLDIQFTSSQIGFFEEYWKQQLMHELDIPDIPQSIDQLIDKWKIDNHFSDWLAAWVIFVYELINHKLEEQRLWSIDIETFKSWNDIKKIQTRYTTT